MNFVVHKPLCDYSGSKLMSIWETHLHSSLNFLVYVLMLQACRTRIIHNIKANCFVQENILTLKKKAVDTGFCRYCNGKLVKLAHLALLKQYPIWLSKQLCHWGKRWQPQQFSFIKGVFLKAILLWLKDKTMDVFLLSSVLHHTQVKLISQIMAVWILLLQDIWATGNTTSYVSLPNMHSFNLFLGLAPEILLLTLQFTCRIFKIIIWVFNNEMQTSFVCG